MSDNFISYYYGWMTSCMSVTLIAAVIGWRVYRTMTCGAAGPQTFGQLVLTATTSVLAVLSVNLVTALFNSTPVIG